jgi:hypothetical protein
MVPVQTIPAESSHFTIIGQRRSYRSGILVIPNLKISTLENLLRLSKRRDALTQELARLETAIRQLSEGKKRTRSFKVSNPTDHRRRKHMDLATFYAGLQAIAAFLQVWQGEQNRKRAVTAYYQEKEKALAAPTVRNRAAEASKILKQYPRFEQMFGNRIGRCEDEFEAKLRHARDEDLYNAAQQFNKCKCRIMQAMREVAGGELDGTFKDDWKALNCDVLLTR